MSKTWTWRSGESDTVDVEIWASEDGQHFYIDLDASLYLERDDAVKLARALLDWAGEGDAAA